jgi:hypothetical protein
MDAALVEGPNQTVPVKFLRKRSEVNLPLKASRC